MTNIIENKTNDTIVTAGSDGRIIIWKFSGKNLQRESEVVSLKDTIVSGYGIVSLDTRSDSYLISIRGGEIYAFKGTNTKNLRPLAQSHYEGDIDALAVNPRLPFIVTGGTDTYLRMWDINERMQIRQLKHENRIKAIDWSKNDLIVVADIVGNIFLY